MDRFTGMRVVVAIADKGTLTAAAGAMDLSLPSVVRMLAAVERDVGVRLFNRTTRRVHATDDGHLYIDRCRTILTAVEEAHSVLSSRRESPRGRIAVTASVLFGRRFIAPIAHEFIRKHPDVTVDVLLLDRVVNLVEEGIDVGIRIGPLDDTSLVAAPIGSVRRVVCASPAYLKEYGVPRRPADLRAHRCVSFSSITSGADWPFLEGSRRTAERMRPVLVCNQVDAAVDACVAGLGPGMFLSYQVAHLVGGKKLRYLLEEFEPDPIPVNVVFPHARLRSAAVRMFSDECRRRLRSAVLE
jgi:DNA-binding transcriptional LysR family regulator